LLLTLAALLGSVSAFVKNFILCRIVHRASKKNTMDYLLGFLFQDLISFPVKVKRNCDFKSLKMNRVNKGLSKRKRRKETLLKKFQHFFGKRVKIQNKIRRLFMVPKPKDNQILLLKSSFFFLKKKKKKEKKEKIFSFLLSNL